MFKRPKEPEKKRKRKKRRFARFVFESCTFRFRDYKNDTVCDKCLKKIESTDGGFADIHGADIIGRNGAGKHEPYGFGIVFIIGERMSEAAAEYPAYIAEHFDEADKIVAAGVAYLLAVPLAQSAPE